jgi:DNA repair exonuclease SbcCD ATPase subunit
VELDRLLGLDRFELARSSAGTELNRLKERAKEAEAAAPLEKLQQEELHLHELRAQLSKRQAEREDKKKESHDAQAQAAALASQWESVEKLRKSREELLSRAQKLAGSISTWQKMISSAPSPALPPGEVEPKLLALKSARQQLEAELKAAQTTQQELSKTSGQIGERLKNEQTRSLRTKQLLEKQTQLLAGKSPEALRTGLANTQTALQSRLAQTALLEKERQDFAQVLKTLGIRTLSEPSTQAQCPVCHQSLDEAHRHELERTHQTHLKELEQQIAANQALTTSDRKNVERLSMQDAEASRLQAQLSALGEAVDAGQLQTQLDANRQAGAALVSKSGGLQTRLSKLSEEENSLSSLLAQSKQLGQWRSQLEAAEKEHVQSQQQLAALVFDEPAYLALKSQREELLGRTARLAESLRSLEKMLEQDGQLVKMQAQVLERLKLKRAEAEAARKDMDELSSFRNLLLSTQSTLRSRLLTDLNAALSRIWPLVYPYGDWARVRLVASDKDYSVEIHQGEWKALEAHASGGERACLGLALRVALSVLLTPSLGWLILDEPTHNLDSRAVQSLGVALAEALPKIVPQVIVITHENQLVESTPGRVIRFSRDKLKGEDTRVEIEGEG